MNRTDSTVQQPRTSDRRVSWFRTFGFSLSGIVYAFGHERNMWMHFCASIVILMFCLIVRPSPAMTTAVCGVCFLVLAAEVFNTAVEALTDLVTNGNSHPLAKVAKDCAAGSVLLVSIASLCVGCLALVITFPWHFRLFTSVHLLSAILAGTSMTLIVAVFVVAIYMKHSPAGVSLSAQVRRRRPE